MSDSANPLGGSDRPAEDLPGPEHPQTFEDLPAPERLLLSLLLIAESYEQLITHVENLLAVDCEIEAFAPLQDTLLRLGKQTRLLNENIRSLTADSPTPISMHIGAKMLETLENMEVVASSCESLGAAASVEELLHARCLPRAEATLLTKTMDRALNRYYDRRSQSPGL